MRDSQVGNSCRFAREELVAIEQAAVHAWPASETRDIKGWLWRYSGGGFQRANSVSPLNFYGADVEEAIDAVERLYFSRAGPSRFQVIDGLSQPADLDRRLEARGYRIHDPVSTLAKRLGVCTCPPGIRVLDQPSDGWMEIYLSNITPDRHAAAPSILASVPAPRAFLALEADGQVISTALAVQCGGVVIAECVGTRRDERRSGAASRVMAGLEAWGTAQGASIAALQAVTANVPAQQLYAALGYTMVSKLHYRVRDR